MDNKKICCIADTDIKPKVMVLLEEIQSRINLTIPLLGDNDSVVEYEARNENFTLKEIDQWNCLLSLRVQSQ